MATFEEIHDPYHEVRQTLVKQINRERGAAGLLPVELDVFSSLVADHHCQEMAAHRYLSHWDLHGLLPYQRYHLAGGRDHVQENLSRITILSSDPNPIGTEPSEVLPKLMQAHASFMEEKPPLDGHRNNVLYPPHTHVGVGLAVVGPEFTMAEEFLNRTLRLAELPAELPSGPIQIEGQMLRKDFGPYYCILFNDRVPRQLSVKDLERTYAYSETNGDQCAVVRPWEMQFEPSSGRFRFSIKAKNCGAGLYHLLLWARGNVRSIPYRLEPGIQYKVDTSKAVPTAGWVFKR